VPWPQSDQAEKAWELRGSWERGTCNLEGHTAAEHPGWTATHGLLRPYPNQRVVYRRGAPPAS
jgi:hypothetical protein